MVRHRLFDGSRWRRRVSCLPDPDVDVAIVGARVGGSVLAAKLASEGIRVLLTDAAHFPSDTLSTHFFRGNGLLGALQGIGALELVTDLGSPKLIQEYTFLGGGDTPAVGLAQESGDLGFNLSVRRVTLDDALVRFAARHAGVELAERTRATGLLSESGRVTGLSMETPKGKRDVRARIVVGADGRTSWLARQVSAPVQTTEAGHRGVYYAYYSDLEGPTGPPDGAEFSLLGDELAYVFPSDGGLACVALTLNLEAYHWCQAKPEERFLDRLSRHKGLASRMPRAVREGGLRGVGPTPNFVRAPVGPGWALVGDSEMHRDPWTGRGLDSAGTHALLLADSIVRWLRDEVTEEEAGRAYTAARDSLSMADYESTVQGSRDLAKL
jgi:flavin-dependent dehydrogenase